MMKTSRRITREQVRQARQTDLVEYLKARGETMKKEGKNFRLPGHSGLLVAGNKYWHASTGRGTAWRRIFNRKERAGNC